MQAFLIWFAYEAGAVTIPKYGNHVKCDVGEMCSWKVWRRILNTFASSQQQLSKWRYFKEEEEEKLSQEARTFQHPLCSIFGCWSQNCSFLLLGFPLYNCQVRYGGDKTLVISVGTLHKKASIFITSYYNQLDLLYPHLQFRRIRAFSFC